MPGQTLELDGWTFYRASLAYIDITPPGTGTAVEVINCWDYAEGAPEVPDTLAALRREARAWLDEINKHDEREYINQARSHDAIHARDTAPTYWAAGTGLETPHETADRLQQSAHDLNRALGDILADILERDGSTPERAAVDTATALDIIRAHTALQLDRYYAAPDDDPSEW